MSEMPTRLTNVKAMANLILRERHNPMSSTPHSAVKR